MPPKFPTIPSVLECGNIIFVENWSQNINTYKKKKEKGYVFVAFNLIN